MLAAAVMLWTKRQIQFNLLTGSVSVVTITGLKLNEYLLNYTEAD